MVALGEYHQLRHIAGLRRQAGISLMGWVAILLMAGTLGLIGLRMAPVYIDYFYVVDVGRTISAEPGNAGKTKSELKIMVATLFRQNNLRDLSPNIVTFSKDTGQRLVVTIDYEERVNLFGNLDMVAHFRKVILPN